MRRMLFVLLALLVGAVSLFAQTTFPLNGAPYIEDRLYVIRGATVHADATSTFTKADVWVKEGRIVKVGEGGSIPIQAIIIQAEGLHIYPSFIELYSDLGVPAKKSMEGRAPQYERSDPGLQGWNEAIMPEYHAEEHLQPAPEEAKAFREAGFGIVLSHRSDGIIRGTAALHALADKPLNLTLRKARAAQFLSFEKGNSRQEYPRSKMGSIALLRQTFYDQAWYADRGQQEQYDRSLSQLASNLELPQFFLSREKNDIQRGHRIAEEFGMRFHYIGSGNEYERAQEVAAIDGLLVLPLNYPEAYDCSDPLAARHIPLQELRHWELAPSNAAYLQALGARLAFTTMGLEKKEQFLAQLRKAVERGLSKSTAIAALTQNPAIELGVWEDMGSISAGKWADFFIASGDIFESDTRILEHWVQGKAHTVNGIDRTDVSGVYDLKVDDQRYSLEVKENGQASLRSDKSSDTTRIKVDFTEVDRQVNLHFTIPEEGLYRLHGKTNARLSIWDGKGTGPEGQQVAWSAIWKKEVKANKKPAKEEEEQVAVLHYPNNGYGWTERPQPKNLIIRNATVWTNTEQGILEDGDVIIRDGKVVAVGHNLQLETVFPRERNRPQFSTIDAYGKHVTCGIIDEHSHIAISRGVNEGSQASSAEVRIGDVIDPDDIDIFHQLSGGVTAAQLLHGSANPIGGQSAIIKLRWGSNAEEMKVQNAAPFIKFALGENVKQSNWGDRYRSRFPQSRMGVEQVFYDHFIRARAYRQKQLAYEEAAGGSKKKRAGLTRPRTDLEMEALAEILFGERFITCHSYVQSEILMLMDVADSMGFTLNTFTHILEGYKVAEQMAEHGAGASTFSDWWAYKYEVREATPYNAALLREQGITVAINSDDAEMGRRLNQEAAKTVKYGGMSEEEAWKTVTLNPAKLLHLDERMGSLAPGMDADIVIWTDNPLSIYAQAEKTFVDGILFFDRALLAETMEDIAKERAALVAKMMESGGGKGRRPSRPHKKHYHCDDMEP